MIPTLPSRAPGAGTLVPPCTYLADDCGVLTLDGMWSFVYHSTGPAPFVNAEQPWDEPVPVGDASEIDVLSHWALRGEGAWGHPAYTSADLPFPIDLPFPPDDNPVGDYRCTSELPANRQGGHIRLRFDDAESQAIAWANGTWIGMARGSRLAYEFDVTEAVYSGVNTITVRVHQLSPGSYLGGQGQWWLLGIFCSVSPRCLASGMIEDLWADTDYKTGAGYVTIEVRVLGVQEAHLSGHLSIDGLWSFACSLECGEDGHYCSGRVEVGSVCPRSAQDPTLYEARVSVQGSECLDVGERCLCIGFCRVYIEGGVLKVNGEPLTLNGINRHEVRAAEGRVFDEAWAREDPTLMKSMGINAIRTFHYPPHSRVSDLMDETGLWVIFEGNTETYDFEGVGEWIDNPSDDPCWTDAYMDCTVRVFERDKNHPSVMSWSLGNESGTGANLVVCVRWVHERAGSRAIVHYEGDRALKYMDIYPRMYPTLEEVVAVLSENNPHAKVAVPTHVAARVDDVAREYIRRAPYIMCEYLHAVGTGPGNATIYAVQTGHRRHADDFVWEWRNHALWRTLPDGRQALSYGGDFGEEVHDGSLVCDDLIDALSRPHADTWSWVRAVAPGAPVLVKVIEFSRGYGPDETRLCTLLGVPVAVVRTDDDVAVPYALDACGHLAWIGTMPVSVDLSAFKAPTDNDRGRGPIDYWGIDEDDPGLLGVGRGEHGASYAACWERARLHLLRRHLVSTEEEGTCQRVTERWAPPVAQFGVTLAWEYRPVLLGETPALSVSVRVAPCGAWPGRVPRLGVRIEMPGSQWETSRLGDTFIRYSDMRVSGVRGYGHAPARGLWDVSVCPQEGGQRLDLEALRLYGEAGDALVVSTSSLGWSASSWSERELAEVSHQEDLPDSERTFLWLDAFQDGIGTRSCGPDSRPELVGCMRDADLTFVIAQAGGD